MGICFSFKKKRNTKYLLISQKELAANPVVFIEENFKILDHTGELKNIDDVNLMKDKFNDYKVTDLRCVKGSRESKHDHSHLIAVFGRIAYGNIIDELGLIVNYSPYGFAISIGELELITKDSGLVKINIEFLHLPRADNENQIGIPRSRISTDTLLFNTGLDGTAPLDHAF